MIEFKVMLSLSALLFSLGIFSLLSKKNAVSILIGVELILNACALNFAVFSKFNLMKAGILDITGYIFSIFIIVLAAAEAVVALGIFIAIYKFLKNIDVEKADLMRW